MTSSNKQKGTNKRDSANKYTNPIEALKGAGRDIGKGALESLTQELIKKAPQDFADQIFGPRPQRVSAEITAGETIEIKDVLSGQHEKRVQLERRIAYERRLRQEERLLVQKKTNELRIQLQAIMNEVVILTQETHTLSQETKIASMQAPIEPGVYHVIYFEKLLEFLRSFRKKIERAQVWLHAANKRAQKKNWVSSYKKHGAKFLLSGEHYLTRSAG